MKKEDPLYTTALQVLQESRLFSQLDSTVLHELLENFRVVTWKKAETIDSEIGMKYCHLIIEGRLKISQYDPHTGRTITPFLLSRGDIYDVFSLLDGKEHISFPIALDRVTALYLPLEEARACLCEHPEFNKQFLPYLGEMMRRLESFGASQVFYDTATRLADLILRHVHPEKDPRDGTYHVELINNLSHESLAEMIGSVRSVVSSQMHKLKEEGIIFSRRGHLAVQDLEKLMRKIEHFDTTDNC